MSEERVAMCRCSLTFTLLLRMVIAAVESTDSYELAATRRPIASSHTCESQEMGGGC